MVNKKQKEEESLREAFAFARKKAGRTHRVLHMLEGEIIQKEERPDFIILGKPSSKHDRGKVIGIEHFSVDQYAYRNKRGEMESISKKGQYKVENIRQKYKDSIGESEQLDKAFDELLSSISNINEEVLGSGYNSFIDSFRYSLEQHEKKIPDYRKTLNKIAQNKHQILLCFFIEVYTDFSELLLVTDKSVGKCPKGVMPMFEDVLCELEKLRKKGVDYILIAMREAFTSKLVDVVALPVRDIRGEFLKQNGRIYLYAGQDRLLHGNYSELKDAKIKFSTEKKAGCYNVTFTVSGHRLTNEMLLRLFNNALYCAYWAKEHGKCYATQAMVQAVMESMGKYLVKWTQGTGEENWVFIPIYKNLPELKDIMQQLSCIMEKYKEEL